MQSTKIYIGPTNNMQYTKRELVACSTVRLFLVHNFIILSSILYGIRLNTLRIIINKTSRNE